MKNYLPILFILLFLVAGINAQTNDYWEEAPGPYGGGVGISQTLNNLLYATHYDGAFYRSEDYGVHWQRINVPAADPGANEELLRVGFSGTFYKIVTYFTGNGANKKLFTSSNEGANWVLKNDNLQVINFEETPSGTLIGLDVNGHIYRSLNGGADWSFAYAPNIPLSFYSFFLSFASNGKILLTDGDLSGGFAISSDEGLTWTEGSVPGFLSTIRIVSSGTLFVISDFNATSFFRSSDFGVTWETVDFNLAPNEYLTSVFDLNTGRLLASTNLHIYFSDDDGVTWDLLPTGAEHAYEFVAHFPLPNGDILGFMGGSLCRSTDDGVNWALSSEGIHQADVKQLALLTDSLQMAVTGTGLWRTENAGGTWTRLMPDTSDVFLYSIRPLAVFNEDSFAVKSGKKIWISTDGGQSFDDISPNGGLKTGHIFATPGGRLFCSSSAGVERSNDLNGGWTTVIPGVSVNILVQHPSGSLFAYTTPLTNTFPKTLWRSTDEGASWSIVTTLAITTDYRRALFADAGGKIYVTGYFDNSMKLAVSDNEGASWTYRVIPDIYAYDEFIAVNDIGRIFMSGGSDIKILTSADAGESWYYLPVYDTHPSLLNGLEVSPSGKLYIVPSSATLYRSTGSTEVGAYITGHVSKDADSECSTPDAQEPLKNWVVKLEGVQDWYATTNANGRYTFFVDTGTYEVHALTPQFLWWNLCDSVQTVISDSMLAIDTVDFAVIGVSDCPLMSADVAIPQLRRCFNSTVFVQYCNQGSQTADSAWVDVQLDPYLSFVSSQQPHFNAGNNTYRFLLGNIASGDCGSFNLEVYTDCDSTVLGQTHCVLAHAFPDTLCTVVQNWSGATIQAEVSCEDTTVQLKLRNTGAASSQILNYIIIEDDVVLFQGQNQYDISEDLTLNYPANGHTWRIESQQEPGHPFSNVAVAFNEGCGGFESLGFINQFNVNTFMPSWDQVCVENIGSYDPNDKQGFPTGFGDEHRIRPGQELEYLIRFQNTGTDTAFNIVISDTLSAWLNPASVHPGVSSHPYTWALSGQGVLHFSFNNILLPDSNTNLAGSQGFVSFRIGQRADVPLGAKIFNTADIYFDFNDPVVTNQTLHTVGVDYITGTHFPAPANKTNLVRVSPNPVLESTVFQLNTGIFQQHRLFVADAFGRKIREVELYGKQYVFQRRDLPPGAYFYRVEDAAGRWVDSGTLLLR